MTQSGQEVCPVNRSFFFQIYCTQFRDTAILFLETGSTARKAVDQLFVRIENVGQRVAHKLRHFDKMKRQITLCLRVSGNIYNSIL